MALMYLPLYVFLLGICSTLLWLPALGVGIGLLVCRPSCRRKLGVLFGLWGLSMVLLLGDSLGRVERKRPAAKLGVHRASIFLGSRIDCAVDCRSLVCRTALFQEVDRLPCKNRMCTVCVCCVFGGIFLFGVDHPDGRGGNLAGAAGGHAEDYLERDHLFLLSLRRAVSAGRVSGVVGNPLGSWRAGMVK